MKPSFKYLSDRSIQVPAATNSPIKLTIGGVNYTLTTSLECHLTRNGVGGLRSGDLGANTAYYLYAIISNARVQLIADVIPPSEGLPDVNWTYLGAFCTNGSSVVTPFFSDLGVCLHNGEVETETLASITRTEKTFSSLPVTATKGYFQVSVVGTTTGVNTISGRDNTNDSLAAYVNVNGVANGSWGWVPIFTPQKIWMTCNNAANTTSLELYGWHENPEAYL